MGIKLLHNGDLILQVPLVVAGYVSLQGLDRHHQWLRLRAKAGDPLGGLILEDLAELALPNH